jgi:hypothetical protein
MFNKQYNLAYGLFLQNQNFDIQILYYKKPSMSIETNDMFKVLIDELYNTPICDDKNEDSKIKK